MKIQVFLGFPVALCSPCQAGESTYVRPGLGPGPGWGPYGPIWALMLVFKSEALRVQTAPFDKIRIEFRRSRRRLFIPDLLKAKKMRRQIIIF